MKRNARVCWPLWLGGLALAAMLGGCGGGGGGGDASAVPSTPAPVTPTQPATTGLVPAPGVLGAVLYEQAQTLRPLREGAVWVYRELDYTTGMATELRTTQSARSGNVFRETDSGDADNPTDVRIGANGDVIFSASLPLGTGAPAIKLVDAVELRTPVRAGDQLVIVDQRVEKSGLDVDKDGKDDPVDVALWRTVAGKEAVTLPTRTDPVMALRVDSTVVVRVLPSGGGASQIATTMASAWYAPGVGLIRQAVKISGSPRPWDSEQTLLGYDGGDQGFGYVASTPSVTPMGGIYSKAEVLPQAILLASGGRMLVLDLKGKAKAVQPTLNVAQVGQAGGTAWARVEREVNSNAERHDFYRVAADGTPESSPFMTLDPLDQSPAGTFNTSARFVSTSGAPLIWAYFVRSTFAPSSGGDQVEIVLRRHDLQGWVGHEIKLPVPPTTGDSVSVLAQPSGLWVSWSQSDTSARQTRHVVKVSSDGSVGPPTVLPLPSALEEFAPQWTLVGPDTGPWALWWGKGPGGQMSAHGVRLDASGALVGTAATAAALTAAELPALADLPGPLQPYLNLTVSANTWMFAADAYGAVYPDETWTRFYVDVRQMEPGSGAPASTLRTVARYRLPGRSLVNPPIVFDRYTLLLTDVSPVVVWH